MTKTYYIYCDKNGEPYQSPKLKKLTLYVVKPTPMNLAIQKYATDGECQSIKAFKLVEVK